MTADWLSKLDPPPPDELADAIRRALGESAEQPSADQLLHAAEDLLKKVIDTNCDARSSAIDLLAVDALVTQALLVATAEASLNERDGSVHSSAARDDFAEEAMRRLSRANSE